MRWTFHTIPHPGEFGYETWPPDAWKISGGANAWAGLSVDPKLGMVFAATGSASFDFYGANRIGDNLFADCVLALDARTGKRIWHFQGVKHDRVGSRFSRRAEPGHRDAERTGKWKRWRRSPRPATSSCWTARPASRCSPSRYRPVPASTLDGEKLAETQPYPVKPPPFTRQSLHRRHGHQSDARSPRRRAANGCASSIRRACSRRPAARHGAVSRHRWRRRMGRRGLRPGDRLALRQLQRAAVDHPHGDARHHVALQEQLRQLP